MLKTNRIPGEIKGFLLSTADVTCLGSSVIEIYKTSACSFLQSRTTACFPLFFAKTNLCSLYAHIFVITEVFIFGLLGAAYGSKHVTIFNCSKTLVVGFLGSSVLMWHEKLEV